MRQPRSPFACQHPKTHTVVAVGHAVDLALLTVSDETFWTEPTPMLPLQLGDVPTLQENVLVGAVQWQPAATTEAAYTCMHDTQCVTCIHACSSVGMRPGLPACLKGVYTPFNITGHWLPHWRRQHQRHQRRREPCRGDAVRARGQPPHGDSGALGGSMWTCGRSQHWKAVEEVALH